MFSRIRNNYVWCVLNILIKLSFSQIRPKLFKGASRFMLKTLTRIYLIE